MAKTPAKRARTTPPADQVDEDRFVLVPGAGIDMRIKGVDYRLRKLRVGEWRDLNEMRLANARQIRAVNVAALALPVGSEDEAEADLQQETQRAALQAARDLSFELALDWWMTLIETVCTSVSMPVARDLPGWATDMGTQEGTLNHLIGPFGSGPMPPTTE